MYSNKVFTPNQWKDRNKPSGLYSDIPNEAGQPSAIGRRRTALIAVVLVLLLLAAGAVIWWVWATPQSSPVDIQMYGLRMTEDGTQLTAGNVVLRGTRLEYRADDRPTEIKTTELVLLDGKLHSQEILLTETDGLLYGAAANESQQITYDLTIEIAPDGSWCVIRQNDLYIVCSVEENFDPLDIFVRSNFSNHITENS